MATDLDDLFGRSGTVIGSSAAPTGGSWAALTNGFTYNVPILDGDVARLNEFEPYFFRNDAAQTGNQSQVTLYFTPYSDNWQAAVHLRVQADGFTSYQLLFGPGEGVISKRTTSSQTWHGTQLGSTATNVVLPASHRSLVTLVFAVSSTGVLTATVNGTSLNFGVSVSEVTPLAVGAYGFGGRAIDVTRILGEGTTASGSTASGASLIATASILGGSASGGSSAGSFNLNSSVYAFKRNTGSLITSTSVTFFVSNPNTGALIGSAITGLSTNASGIVTSPVTNASVVAGTTYRINYKFSTGEYGVVELAAA